MVSIGPTVFWVIVLAVAVIGLVWLGIKISKDMSSLKAEKQVNDRLKEADEIINDLSLSERDATWDRLRRSDSRNKRRH